MKGNTFIAILFVAALILVAQASAMANIESAIANQFEQYQVDYPDIHFLHFGDSDPKTVAELSGLLGKSAVNVDYEHDADSSEILLEAQLGRIHTMVTNGLPSSTLFRVNEGSGFKRPFVCVVTLDAKVLSENPEMATRIMLGDVDPTVAGVRDEARLDNATFASFTVDHEIFHCLDAYLNGPTFTKTFDQMEASYQRFVAEQRADLFATAMHRRRSPQDPGFLQQLHHYRTLTLLDWDTSHYTSSVMEAVKALPVASLQQGNVPALVQQMSLLADTAIPDYKAYIEYLVAAYDIAIKREVYGVSDTPEAGVLAAMPVEESMRRRIQRQLEHAEAQVFG